MVYNLSYQGKIDIQAKITNFIKVTGIINSVFKPNLLQLYARLRVYSMLAKPTLYYGSEAWTVKKQDGKQLEAAEMRFMRRTAEYRYNSGQEKKRKEHILEELQVELITTYLQRYKAQWKSHIERITDTRWPDDQMV
jgi:hypothetical protein